MSERVSINYSIKLQHLDSEVERLFNDILDDIDDMSLSCSLPPQVLSAAALSDVRDLKDCIIDLHYRLTDVENIIKAYLKHVSTQDEKQPTAELTSVYDKLSVLSKVLSTEDTIDEVAD